MILLQRAMLFIFRENLSEFELQVTKHASHTHTRARKTNSRWLVTYRKTLFTEEIHSVFPVLVH